MRRLFAAVLLAGVVHACDSGSFGSHFDRGPVKLVFTAQPTAAAADEAIGAVVVTVRDSYGNTVPGARTSITVAIGTNPGGATLSGTTTLAAAGGVAVFSDLVIDRGGSGYTLTAEASGLTSAVSGPIDVRGPVKLAFIAQPTAALVGAAMRSVVVAVQDKDGHNMANAHASITVAIGANPGSGVLSGTTTLPAVGGVAVFSDLVINNSASGYTLTAEASGLVTATSSPIDVTVVPPAAKLAFAVQPGADAGWEPANNAMTPAVQVSILDEQGKIVMSSTMDVTVAISAGPAGAILSGTRTVAAVNGVATFRDLSIDIPDDNYTLAATACSLPSATSSTFRVVDRSTVPGCLKLSSPPLAAVPFGFQTIGTSSTPRAITMTNTCAWNQDISAGGTFNSFNWQDWSVRSHCPPQLLGPGASCTLDVTFSPTGPGNREADFNANYGLPNNVFTGVDGTAIGELSMSVAPDPSGASGGFVYVANADAGIVSSYRIDRDTGVLAPLVPPLISAGTNPASVTVDRSGKFAYVPNAGSNSISMYRIGSDGLLASIGPPVATGNFPVSMALAPDPAGGPGRFAYVANAGSNDISMYRIDSGTGSLTSLGTIVAALVPWFITVHPSGKFAYVESNYGGGRTNSTVHGYTVDHDTGVLTAAGLTDCAAPTMCGGTVPSALAIDPSGRFIALTNQGDLVMNLWNTDPSTGTFSGTGSRTDLAEQTATSLAISVRPSGRPFAYVTYGSGAFASRPGTPDNSVFTYSIDPSTSQVTFAGSAAAGSSPTSIALDPSGKFAYVANAGSRDISMYAIDADGTLTPLVPGTIGIPVPPWTTVGSMGTPREGQGATLLPSGKVLVAGGYDGDCLASAELYDPGTGTWSGTGSLTRARNFPSTTVLLSGKVLVAGGDDCDWGLGAELYDPDNGTWSRTGSMVAGRRGQQATLLPSGKVLVTGGYGLGGLLASAELYDPATETWSLTAAPTFGPRTATLLPSGKVLVTGYLTSPTVDAVAELYDSSTGTWGATGSPKLAPDTATLLPSGKVLATETYFPVGGPRNDTAELYDPATGTWSATGSPLFAPGTAALVSSGEVLGTKDFDTTAELYDPRTGTWSATGSLATGHGLGTATLLSSGGVLVAGGYATASDFWNDYSPLSSAEVFDPHLVPVVGLPVSASATPNAAKVGRTLLTR